jgi:hypothetical protein
MHLVYKHNYKALCASDLNLTASMAIRLELEILTDAFFIDDGFA